MIFPTLEPEPTGRAARRIEFDAEVDADLDHFSEAGIYASEGDHPREPRMRFVELTRLHLRTAELAHRVYFTTAIDLAARLTAHQGGRCQSAAPASRGAGSAQAPGD
jgi:hypothetical protein